MSDEKLKVKGVQPDGIETLEGGLENYHQEEQNKKEEEEVEFELTFEEKKKLLRSMGNKHITDKEINALTDERIEEIKAFAKLKERKAIYRFVYHKKSVTDEDVKNLTDLEIEDMMAKAMIMSRHLSYNPKKKFGVTYKKKRQNRNKMAKASRRGNR